MHKEVDKNSARTQGRNQSLRRAWDYMSHYPFLDQKAVHAAKKRFHETGELPEYKQQCREMLRWCEMQERFTNSTDKEFVWALVRRIRSEDEDRPTSHMIYTNDDTWKNLEGEIFRVITTKPYLETRIQDDKIILPHEYGELYAVLWLEGSSFTETRACITNESDFRQYWHVFHERGVADSEEVLLCWSPSFYKQEPNDLSPQQSPKIVWAICPKGTYDGRPRGMQIHQRPEEKFTELGATDVWLPAYTL